MSCEVPVTCRTVLGQSLRWGGFGGGDDPLRNPASGTFVSVQHDPERFWRTLFGGVPL